MTSLLDLLQAPQGAAGSRIPGVVTGVVTNNQDPEKLGRVKVRFPWLADQQESDWARVAAPMAGNGHGAWLLPQVEDEVLVAFDRGDPRFPYVVGALWSKPAPPPDPGGGPRADVQVIRSRSGHVVRLDDRKDQEKIEITDKSGKNSIVISTKDNAITLSCDGDLTLQSREGKLVLKARKGVEVTSTDALALKGKTVDVKATDGDVKVKGKNIHLN
jgi:uncharacterized protein involved in type VI secretion and phage assembly